MKIIKANMEVPILKAILPLDKEYQDKCIKRIYEIGDEMNHNTNLKASMSDYNLFEKESIFNKLLYKISNFISENYPSEPFWKDDPRKYVLKIINFWSAIYKKNNWAYPHTHHPANISFCYYLQCDKHSQELYFNDLKLSVKPKNNLLVVFPAQVYHSVNKQNEKGIDRILVAGNYMTGHENEKKYTESFFK